MSPPTRRGDLTRSDGAAPDSQSHRLSAPDRQGSASDRYGEVIARGRGVGARGFYGPPTGRRRLGAIVVPQCLYCSYLHRSDGPTTDLSVVRVWWTRRPWVNIGIRIPTGLVALDVDPRNGGAVALAELTHRHGRLPQTLTARTGAGGLHIGLAVPGPARGQLCRGVDVKVSSGCVVAPPSIHASGRRYEWITDLSTVPAP